MDHKTLQQPISFVANAVILDSLMTEHGEILGQDSGVVTPIN